MTVLNKIRPISPKIGDIVHFIDKTGQCCAARVEDIIKDSIVNISVYLDENSKPYKLHEILHSDGGELYTWHWPCLA